MNNMNYDYIKQGDCLELMKEIPDKSIDLILCDLPYGITSCKWDSVIPFDKLWEQYDRIIKDNGATVLFGNEPFSSSLRMSHIKNYKYDWIWKKTKASNHLNAKKQPMRIYENICVFYKKQCLYKPQGLIYGNFNNHRPSRDKKVIGNYVYGKESNSYVSNAKNYPNNVLELSNPNNNLFHPTQKPVELCEYLIKTYTNENDIVLDNCMGSGTTCVACINTNRHYIGFELEEKYFTIAKDRINQAREQLK